MSSPPLLYKRRWHRIMQCRGAIVARVLVGGAAVTAMCLVGGNIAQVTPTSVGLKTNLRGVYCISGRLHRYDSVKHEIAKLGFDVPVHSWPLLDGFNSSLQDEIPKLVRSRLVEPAAIPRILVKSEWREKWKQERRWRHVRREREAPGRRNGGWLFGLDLTRGALAHAVSHLQLWKRLANHGELLRIPKSSGTKERAYLVVDDYCTFGPEFCKETLDERLQLVPDDWELVFLAGTDELGMQKEYEVAPGVRRLYPWFRPGAAYLVTTKGARSALKACTPLRWRLDCELGGAYSSRNRDASSEERLFSPSVKPIGYTLAPALIHGKRDVRHPNLTETQQGPPDGVSDDELQMFEGLDTAIAWSMRLTDRPVMGWSSERKIEGHSNMVPESMRMINELAEDPDVETICEIGFNGGHSTLRWLLHSNAKVYSFDLGRHEYARPAAAWLANKFPGRLVNIWGDSVDEVPKFHAKNPEVKCDLIFIDGDHSVDKARLDIKNFMPLANPAHHKILMDDANLDGVKTAWQEIIDAGKVVELQNWVGHIQDGNVEVGFAVGYYTDSALAECQGGHQDESE